MEILEENFDFEKMANAIRILSMDAVEKANSGHPGMPLGFADVMTMLAFKLKFSSDNPKWVNRDRLILSAGHGSMLLYSLYYLLGYKSICLDDIKNFRQLHAKTAGHPEYGLLDFVETTTGPLGQGLSNAVGMALAERRASEKLGKDIIDHNIYAIIGDGCLMEGVSQEAISFAGRQRLSNLIVLWDDNNITIDGKVSLSDKTDQLQRFLACGFDVQKIDGHDHKAVLNAIDTAKSSDCPSLIACKTIIGKTSPNKANSEKSHGSPLGKDEIETIKKSLNFPKAEFEIDKYIMDQWLSLASLKNKEYQKWHAVNEKNSEKIASFFSLPTDNEISQIEKNIKKEYLSLAENQKDMASRASFGKVIELLMAKIPNFIGGSADLSGSNNTKNTNSSIIDDKNPTGNYIYYGIREHAMAGIMNGLSLYGGIVPYGGTFMVFSDYCRPALRLGAMMGLKSIYVFTHDSIGVGEDGPTHQPIEHYAALRAIPNLNLYRPCDIGEVLESVCDALTNNAPAVISLSRQKIANIRSLCSDFKLDEENKVKKGAYKIYGDDDASLTFFATGSEIEKAFNVAKKFNEKNIKCRVVSFVSTNNFDKQSDEYKKSVLGTGHRIFIEASIAMSWYKYMREGDLFIGLDDFGISAPCEDVYKYFKLDEDSIYENVKSHFKI